MIRILIIDDQRLVLESLKALLESEFEIVGTAIDFLKGIKLVERLKPNIAIIDLNMPHKNGIETLILLISIILKLKNVTNKGREKVNREVDEWCNQNRNFRNN